MQNYELNTIAKDLAIAGFEIGAIKIQPDNPFTWASGWKSPIYNDNRLFLFYPQYRELILDGLYKICNEYWGYAPHVIAGTSTAGIPHADRLAEKMTLPEIYVRDKPKDHGMKNQIEGIRADKDLENQRILLIEDLISTGGSSVKAVQAIRDANGFIDLCISIFSYGIPKAEKMFKGEIPFDKERSLTTPCRITPILTYSLLLETGIETGHIKKEDQETLNIWSADPEKWSEEWKATHSEEKIYKN